MVMIGNCGKFHHDHINGWRWGWMSLPHELIILSVSGERNILTVSKFDKLIIFYLVASQKEDHVCRPMRRMDGIEWKGNTY